MADSVDQEISPEVAGAADDGPAPETGAAHCSRYADTAVDLGYCTRDRVEAATRAFLETGADGHSFGACLVKEGIVTREQDRACERALRGRSSIGGFAILEKVGQGGMGTVFRARQISMDRIVAVKILAPKFAQDPAFKQRFLNEARTCAKLSHLNIINGIDCGEDSGYTYFAMEFVEGRTVKQVLKEKGRLEPDEAFGIIRQMAGALSYARKFDMVHRDIKPDNIMMTPSGVAKLCDLGLAMQAERESNEAIPEPGPSGSGDSAKLRAEKADPTERADVTITPKKSTKCLALGTPHYMSPEQARGESNIDARSDIYSLGATFYHLIVGDTMFSGKTSTEVMMHHVTDEAPNPCVLDPEIPPGLGMIISKMMAKNCADRYANSDELIADLDAVKNGTLPNAMGFNAKSSCGILPSDELRRLRSGGTPRWQRLLPHAAAALLLGVLAYFAAIWFGSKTVTPPNEVAHVTGPVTSVAVTNSRTVPSPSTKIVETVPKTETKPAVTETKKIPDPPKIESTKPPVVPVTNPEAVVIDKPPDPPLPPPVPELPRPELKLTPEMHYAHFLQEYENRAGKMETAKLHAEMSELALASTYAPAKDDIHAELADLKSGWEFEIKVLKKIAEQKAEIDFSPEMAKKWEVPKGKAVGFAETRGLQIEIRNGAAFYIAPILLPPDTIIARSIDATALAKVQFYYARGIRAAVFALMPSLPPAETKRWERKFNLMAVKEPELTAREAYKNLATIAEAKSWKTFSEMVVDFNKDYGSTPTAKTNLAQIHQWQEAALHALEPPSKWRSVFHAATVRDIPNKQGDPAWVELTYDFKTPEQASDFSSIHGQLKIENGRLIVPEGGGDYAHLRFIAPFSTIQSFKATGKSLHKELRPFGVVFIEPAQAVAGPNAGNPMLKMDPATFCADVDNMAENHSMITTPPPVFNWLRDTTIGFKTAKSDKHWTIDDKTIAVSKLPKQFSGGWIALWSAQGNQSWSSIQIVFRPDEQWEKMKKKVEPPPPAPHHPPE